MLMKGHQVLCLIKGTCHIQIVVFQGSRISLSTIRIFFVLSACKLRFFFFSPFPDPTDFSVYWPRGLSSQGAEPFGSQLWVRCYWYWLQVTFLLCCLWTSPYLHCGGRKALWFFRFGRYIQVFPLMDSESLLRVFILIPEVPVFIRIMPMDSVVSHFRVQGNWET